MKSITFVLSVVTVFIFTACSGKQYFEPKKAYNAPAHSYGGSIVSVSRDGGTLKSGKHIAKSGINKIHLGKGYRFLSETNKYILVTNVKGILKVISKKYRKPVHELSLDFPVVAASIKNGIIAYVLNNNTFGLYNIARKKKLIESPSEVTYAIDTRVPSPIFIDNLAVMPMLDGKLIIVDMYNTDNAKVVYLSSYESFNNIIYLSRVGNTLIAATPKKVMTLGNSGQHEYHANISEVASTNRHIYLFTKEGKIMRLSHNLHVQVEKKFKFAHFSAATTYSNKVYALDQKGSLIVLSSNLSKFKIYDIGEVVTPSFVTGSKLYKDGKVIDLSKLGYE
ncbi:MAG: hypothetical protein L3J43_00400 [Sulfurovum sp.]|nr:hypothetical protein [Sulfurovum sp.]